MAEMHGNDDSSYHLIDFTTEGLRSIFLNNPEVTQMGTTFTVDVYVYKLTHIVCIGRFLNATPVCYGLPSDVKVEIMSLFVDSFCAADGRLR